MTENLSEQQQVRRQKLSQLLEAGFNYPNDSRPTGTCEAVRAAVEKSEGQEPKSAVVSGRIVSLRLMGKAAFCHIQDRSGRIQAYVRRDDVGEDAFKAFKRFDLGDIVEASGYGFITKTGEASLHATGIRLLVKCLNPLPEKFHGLADKELRYRQRHLDLIVNQEVRDLFRLRASIIKYIRNFLDERDYLEVETPVMSAVASGASAKPFVTQHNALDLTLHLRIALELPLKRLVVGGFERVYELSRVFRNEGISSEHNPEFTMIEFYQAYANYTDLMELTEQMLSGICRDLVGTYQVNYRGKAIDLTPPWTRVSMLEALHKFSDLPDSIETKTLEGVRKAGRHLGVEGLEEIDDYGRALFEVFDQAIEEKIVQPTFITQHPTSISPLSRPLDENPEFAERFELIVGGTEIANAFSELNDPLDQKRRFEEQTKAREAGDEEAMPQDHDFVTALEVGMPPAAGEGIGIDRLVMLMSGAQTIREVILFPLLKPAEVSE